MKKADLAATPPADEALEGQIALTLQASGVYPYPQFVKSLVALFKSHTEQEKAAANLKGYINGIIVGAALTRRAFSDGSDPHKAEADLLAELRDGGGK